MKKTIFIILLLVAFPSVLWSACTGTANYSIVSCDTNYNPEAGACCMQPASCAIADVQAAVNNATATDGTKYGDGVYLPTCTTSWTAALDLTGKHGIVVKGNGTDNTVITVYATTNAIDFTGTDRVRLTNTHFVSPSASTRIFWANGGPLNFRIDNNLITGTTYYVLIINGQSSGVFDSNTLGTVASPINLNAGGLVYYGGGLEEYIEAPIDFTDFSGAPWVFVENNILNTNNGEAEMLENDNGGNLYVRYNVFNEVSGRQGSMLEQHNRPRGWGGRVQIHNNNKAILTQSNGDKQYLIRHGTALIYNNFIDYSARDASFYFFDLRSYRAGSNCETDTNTVNASTDIRQSNWTDTMMSRCCSTSEAMRALYYTNLTHNPVVSETIHGGTSGATAAVTAWTGQYDNITITPVSGTFSKGENILDSSDNVIAKVSTADTYLAQGEGVPCQGQPGVGVWGSATPLEPIYIWGNKATSNGSTITSLSTVDLLENSWATRSGYEYCITGDTTQPTSCGTHTLSFTPHPCPHPLTGYTGTCDTSSATMYGTTGYNIAGGSSTTTISGCSLSGGSIK